MLLDLAWQFGAVRVTEVLHMNSFDLCDSIALSSSIIFDVVVCLVFLWVRRQQRVFDSLFIGG